MRKNGDSIAIARKYLDSLVIESRLVGTVKPTSRVTILGTEFETPILPGALSHLKNGMAGYARGAQDAGALCSVGMGDIESLSEVLATGAKVIKIIKPYADQEEIFSRIRFAETHGAFAVGMDVEHAPDKEGNDTSKCAGYMMKLPTMDDLKAIIASTELPFFIKGALSVHDAVCAKELGTAGVILSHHNGLMPWAMPPYALLPEIRKAVGDDFLQIADGGIEDGADAFKALALGADLVCVSRPLMEPYKSKGSAGVTEVLQEMTKELRTIMMRTGISDVSQMDSSVLHKAWWL